MTNNFILLTGKRQCTTTEPAVIKGSRIHRLAMPPRTYDCRRPLPSSVAGREITAPLPPPIATMIAPDFQQHPNPSPNLTPMASQQECTYWTKQDGPITFTMKRSDWADRTKPVGFERHKWP
jgi:hypothetical protein